MNPIKKPLLVAGIVGTVGTGALFTGTVANAESGTNTNNDPASSLIDKLASTFKLDKSKVQEVFDQQRAEMDKKHEERVNERLQKLVDDKTITEAQKTAIQAKLAELKKQREADREEVKELDDNARKQKMDEKKNELEGWAKEQGLDLSKLKGVFGGPGGRGGEGGPRP